MAKAFDDDTNQLLRRLAREILQNRPDWTQQKLGEVLGVSRAYISDFLNENRGAGLAMLTGLGRLAPLEFLGMLGIDPALVATLVESRRDLAGVDLMQIPEVVRRAARAVIELDGCSPAAAGDAAVTLYEQLGHLPGSTADYWFDQIRTHVRARRQSGERPVLELRKLEAPKKS